MNTYRIEHKILTLASCAVMENQDKPASFEIDGMEFIHWDDNVALVGWPTRAWIVSTEIVAINHREAFTIFLEKLNLFIPRISFISQSYIEHMFEPFLIHKKDSNVVFFRYSIDTNAVGLMFMEEEKKALEELLENKDISREFYYYWKDAVNAIGYSAKLLLMFSAIEALVKKDGKKDWKLIYEILGTDLVVKLFGVKGNTSSALRNRLVHGEYFIDKDKKDNYLDLIHKKIIQYFNKKIFSKNLIHENVVSPQRHIFGNKKIGAAFVKRKDGNTIFSLKDMLIHYDNKETLRSHIYELVHWDKSLKSEY